MRDPEQVMEKYVSFYSMVFIPRKMFLGLQHKFLVLHQIL